MPRNHGPRTISLAIASAASFLPPQSVVQDRLASLMQNLMAINEIDQLVSFEHKDLMHIGTETWTGVEQCKSREQQEWRNLSYFQD